MSWPPPGDLVLRGQQVELTPFDGSRDADELFAALDEDAVWRYVSGRPSVSGDLTRSIGEADNGRFAFTVRLAASMGELPSGAVVGTTSYLEPSATHARLEIGWTCYSSRVWASAVNPDAKLQLLRYAFDELGAGRVQLKTDVRNARSQQAISRLGASFEGVLRRYQRRSDNTVRDTVLFSILAEEWPTVRGRLLARVGEDAPN
jgi:RimJ/RimL family protein N-acetyltransferase